MSNKMKTHFMEATGIRVIGMYVQEYFHWGWQPYGQENDDGIDGEIIPRTKDGTDLGVRIYVQSKCGPGYISSENDDSITISPYSNKQKLKEHITTWNGYSNPVILVFTNPEKKNTKKLPYIDLKSPVAYWIRMDEYKYGIDGETVIKLRKDHLFQEHTKGELKKIIQPYLTTWKHYPEINATKTDLRLWQSTALKSDAKSFFKQWKQNSPTISIKGVNKPLLVSRIGWRHITNNRRGDRVELSEKLLPIAKVILENSEQLTPVVLKSQYQNTYFESRTDHLGFRMRVYYDGASHRIQVVVKHYVNIRYSKEKYWFYSVHIIKQ